MLHLPQHAGSKLAFLMSHPFGEEKLWSHRVFVSFARALAARGHVVLRFDYTGAGDSTGEIADTSLATHVADASAALSVLLARPEVERVGLIGLRLGATFAALVAEQAGTNEQHSCLWGAPLVLWDPVMDGQAHFEDLLRSNLSTQLAVYGKVVETREMLRGTILAGNRVNVDGYEIARPLFESCSRANLLSTESKLYAAPTLVVQIAASETTKPRRDLQSLAEAYAQGTFARVTEQPFWREIKPFYGRAERLQQATLAWLEQQNV